MLSFFFLINIKISKNKVIKKKQKTKFSAIFLIFSFNFSCFRFHALSLPLPTWKEERKSARHKGCSKNHVELIFVPLLNVLL